MAVDLGLDDEILVINNIGQSATGWATGVRNFVQNFGSTSSGNMFGSAALRTAGTGDGNVPVLDSAGDLPVSVVPSLPASQITSGTLPTARGGTGFSGTLDQLKTHLGIGAAGDTFDGNLTQNVFTMRSDSTTVAAGDASFRVERGTSGGDAEIRFDASESEWQLSDLNDGGTFKQILAANIDNADRGKFLQVRTGSNIADWADLPVVQRNYTDSTSITFNASRNFIASGTTADDIIDHAVTLTPTAANLTLTLTTFGSAGDGMLLHNASSQHGLSIAGLANVTGAFRLGIGQRAEVIRFGSSWIVNDGFKPVAFSLNDGSVTSIADNDTIPFRDVSGNISQNITFSALKTAIGNTGGGGTTFTPSQDNLFSAVSAIIVGGTDDANANTITIKEVPAAPNNPTTQWLRGDNTWAAFPGISVDSTEVLSLDATNDDLYFRQGSSGTARRIAASNLVLLRPEHTTAASGNRNHLVKISSTGGIEFVDDNRVPSTGTGVLIASAANTFAFGNLTAAHIPSLDTSKITQLPVFNDGADGQVWTKSGNNMIWSTPATGGGGGGNVLALTGTNIPEQGGVGNPNAGTFRATATSAQIYRIALPTGKAWTDYYRLAITYRTGTASTPGTAGGGNEGQLIAAGIRIADIPTVSSTSGGWINVWAGARGATMNAVQARILNSRIELRHIDWNAQTQPANSVGQLTWDLQTVNLLETGTAGGGGLFTSDDAAATIALNDDIHFVDATDSTAKQTTFGSAINQFISRPDTSTSSSKQFVIRAASGTTYTRQTGLAAGDVTSGTFADARIPSISLTTKVSGILPIANGGTNASTASAALENLGGVPRPVFDIDSVAADRTITNDDYGQLIGINSDGAARTVTLPSTLDDEFRCQIFLDGAGTNPVTISIPGGNIVQGSDEDLFTNSPDTVVLRQSGDCVTVHKLIPQNWWLVLPDRIQRKEVPTYPTTNTTTQFLRADGTWAVPAGGTSFTPTQANLFSSVSPIIVGGTNVTIDRSTTNNTVTINASGGGGGGGAEFPTAGTGFLHRTAENVDPTWRGISGTDLPTIPVNKGGTGSTTAANARTALGIDDWAYESVSGNLAVPNTANNRIYEINTQAASRSVTLPANPEENFYVAFRKSHANNNMVISAGSGDNINGAGSVTVGGIGDTVHLRSKGTAGWVAWVDYAVQPIALGGTGSTTAAGARTALGIGAIGTKSSLVASDIPSLNASKINAGTFPAARLPTISIAKGGTGATTAAAGRTALGAAPVRVFGTQVSTSRTTTDADNGQILAVNSDLASRIITLHSTAADNFTVTIMKDSGNNNTVTIRSPNGHNFVGRGTADPIITNAAQDSIVLDSVNDSVTITRVRNDVWWWVEVNRRRLSEVPPRPTSNQTTQFLAGDGTWRTPAGGSATTNASDLTSGTLAGARLALTDSDRLVPTSGTGALTRDSSDNIVFETLGIANGGTGAITAANARTNLGLGSLATKSSLVASDIPSLNTSKISTGTFIAARLPTVPITKGGTGATTAANARSALGIGTIGTKSSLLATDIPNLAASKINSGTFSPARLAAGGSDNQVLTRTSTGMAWEDAPSGGGGGGSWGGFTTVTTNYSTTTSTTGMEVTFTGSLSTRSQTFNNSRPSLVDIPDAHPDNTPAVVSGTFTHNGVSRTMPNYTTTLGALRSANGTPIHNFTLGGITYTLVPSDPFADEIRIAFGTSPSLSNSVWINIQATIVITSTTNVNVNFAQMQDIGANVMSTGDNEYIFKYSHDGGEIVHFHFDATEFRALTAQTTGTAAAGNTNTIKRMFFYAASHTGAIRRYWLHVGRSAANDILAGIEEWDISELPNPQFGVRRAIVT